jgi:C-methyltransferase C-terminal domain/Putative zinc binding domain
VDEHACRACRGSAGHLVLDLGDQPACDYFPRCDDPGPDPAYPLQMWLCSSCGLAQLLTDPTMPEEPRGAEPAALVAQAADAVERVTAAGWLPERGAVAEYGSPHGGSWLGLLAARGLVPVDDGGQAGIILDCFGLMHAADQQAALAERSARVMPGGVLLLQYHALSTIMGSRQWNALRHGHYAYYSTTALTGMLAAVGFNPRTAWQFDLYGGTVLLAATRDGDGLGGPDEAVRSLLAEDARMGVRDPGAFLTLQQDVHTHARTLHDWLAAERSAGRKVLGYGAASRAVALLSHAQVDRLLLPAVIDASPAKQGLRMPGSGIPVANPAQLAVCRPDAVLLLVPDLLAEVRNAFPQVEDAGGRWVDVETIRS